MNFNTKSFVFADLCSICASMGKMYIYPCIFLQYNIYFCEFKVCMCLTFRRSCWLTKKVMRDYAGGESITATSKHNMLLTHFTGEAGNVTRHFYFWCFWILRVLLNSCLSQETVLAEDAFEMQWNTLYLSDTLTFSIHILDLFGRASMQRHLFIVYIV